MSIAAMATRIDARTHLRSEYDAYMAARGAFASVCLAVAAKHARECLLTQHARYERIPFTRKYKLTNKDELRQIIQRRDSWY